MRTTSSSRGSSITATSDPPAKSTWPLAPREVVADEVGAERAELLGRRASTPSDSPPVAAEPGLGRCRARSSAAVTMRVTAIGDMALTTTPGGRVPAELPGERGHGPLGAAVGAGVGRPPPRPGRDAEDAAVPGRGHDRQRGAEDVEVAVEVHGEHAAPVLLAARGEARSAG